MWMGEEGGGEGCCGKVVKRHKSKTTIQPTAEQIINCGLFMAGKNVYRNKNNNNKPGRGKKI